MNHRRKQRLAVVALAAIVAVGSWGASSGMTKLDTVSTSSTPSTARQQAASSTLKVVYIGGSITEGAFSTTPEKSYSGLLTAWLGTRYHKVEARNLGVGGTGSEFAVYRLNHDLAGFVPDLAFLEFSVNDAGTPRTKITAQIDAIVYELRRANPRVKIVYISTTDVGELPQRKAGHRASFVEDSAAVAAFEKLQFIDATTGMWAKILAGAPASTWLEDNVHPNDAGHKLYFEAIRNALASQIPLPVQPAIVGSRLINRTQLQTARLESATGCKRDVTAPKYLGTPLKYMDMSITCARGERFIHRFTGTTVGIVRAMVKDGGQMDCTLDGGAPTKVDFYDTAVAIYDRSAPMVLYRNLTPGAHTLACKVNNALISLPSGTSAGHRNTIGYIMVSNERSVDDPL